MIRTRLLPACAAACALINLPGAGQAQTAFPNPIRMTQEETGTRANDVYAPRMIYQVINGVKTLVMYFGGWYRTDPEELPNDAIYRAVCPAPNQCGPAQKVIDPVAAGLGSASMVNNPTIVELHNYGQDYLVMYMTGVPGEDRNNAQTVSNNKIYYSVSWAKDGVNWTPPALLLDCGWLPSATLDQEGNVILYANTNGLESPGFLARYNLGPSGVDVGAAEAVATNTGQDYENVEVKYRPSINLFQMVAQQASAQFDSEIDYLDSVDGVHFVARARNITQPGMTPGVHPDTSCWVYYGEAPAIYLANIWLRSWC
jgi:hypothetical protein